MEGARGVGSTSIALALAPHSVSPQVVFDLAVPGSATAVHDLLLRAGALQVPRLQGLALPSPRWMFCSESGAGDGGCTRRATEPHALAATDAAPLLVLLRVLLGREGGREGGAGRPQWGGGGPSSGPPAR